MSIMRVRFQIAGTTGLPGVHTTYWTGASSTPVSADALDVVARVRAFWNAAVGLLASGVTVNCNQPVDILDVPSGTLLGQLGAGTPATVTGTGTGELPRATMLLLKYNTAIVVNGRRLAGRSFIGPIATTSNSLGSVVPASNTTLLTAATQLNSGATASLLVVWHRPTGTPPTGGLTSPVISYAANSEFSVLRSRRD